MLSIDVIRARAPGLAHLVALAATFSLAACGDDGSGPVEMDAGPVDVRAPSLVSTNPLPDERGVSPETVFLLQFDEPMDTAAGTVTVMPGDLSLAAASGSWFEGDTRLQLRPPQPLGQGVDYEVIVDGFQDVAGNAAEQETLTFQTLDEEAPVVVSSTPAQGASDLSARIEEIQVEFSEPMDQDDGDVDLQGGPRSIGPAEWIDERTVRWQVDQLAYERTYELFLFGFRDAFGNDFDDTVYLDEGLLRFSTGVDDEAPFVASTTPAEGAMEVNPSRTTATFSFVEPMDTSVRGGVIFFDGADEGTAIEGRWNSDGSRLTFEFPPLGQERDVRIDLTGQGHADAVGNPLDLTTYLVDGALDFTSGLDTFPPTVVSSTLADGASDVDLATLATIEITFNEAMDASITNLVAVDTVSSDTTDLPVAWNDQDRVAVIDAAPLNGGVSYAIDVTVLTDTAGNPIGDDAFGDGSLDFSTLPPTGETCGDALTIVQATEMDGVYSWDLAAGAVTEVDDGAETCDSTPGADVVIEYVKTTASFTDGGQLLKVAVDSADDVNLEVSEGVCDPGDDAFASLQCVTNVSNPEIVLDVGPGTYFIYASDWFSSDPFPAMTVTVEETDVFPEGEACVNPYDVGSSIYTAPATADDPHVWLIPEGAVGTYDRTDDNGSDPSPCGSDTSTVGPDAVIEFDKVDANSVLQVTVENLASSTLDDLLVNVSTSCDATDTDAVVGCVDQVDGGADVLAVSAPAGPVFIWLLRDDTDFFPETRVSIREVTVSEGEACSFPRPITATGATAVTLDSGERFGVPSCFPETGNITWFSYTAPADGYVKFTPNGAGAIALVDGAEHVCSNADFTTTPAIFANGQEICIGIANDAALTSIDVAELTYDGLAGTVTDPLYERAVDDDGDPVSWTSDAGMAATPTTLYLSTTSTVFALPKAGGDRALEITELTSSDLGDVIIARGEDLYAIDDTTSSSSNRVFRLWDGFAFPWDPEPWDTTRPTYPTDDMIAGAWDGSDFVYASNDFTEAAFFRVSANRAGEATQIGVTNDVIEDVISLAADDTWIWYLGQADLDAGSDTEGLFRIRRADLATDSNEPEPILVEENLSAMSSYGTTLGPAMFLDDVDDPAYLYFRTMNPNQVHVIADPAGANPVYLGSIVSLGGSGDYAMTLDRGTGSLFLFETATTSDGRIVKID